ncbi:hypothetical protein [Hydrogenivirga sp. 128-5-R1-1]|uniref:hypothetical protein n=1 Tax=Hydrogenivirga sp. 128-5-R1-1 TaxID=392423 RepID=UPI00015EF745|nr:hypothetical protein [Hydrogenivirga sp. 128-5-R1-1]EDP75615.1 hypothetical protein HG1285_16665 [Hydrogenivirga sp. 128-5-R1-1]
MHTIGRAVLIFLCTFALAYSKPHSSTSQDINRLLAEQGFPEIKLLSRKGRIIVFKALLSVDPDKLDRVYTCLLSEKICVEGYPTYLKDNRLLLVRNGRFFELDLATMKERVLGKLPAVARVGEDKRVEIVHEGRVIKIRDPFPKHWVYPKERGVVPCEDIYWTWGEDWNLFVSREGRVVKKRGKRFVCILGKVIDLRKDGERITFRPARRVIKKVATVTGSFSASFFRGLVILLGRIGETSTKKMIVMDKDLNTRARVDLGGDVRLVVLSDGEFYITLETYDMRSYLYRLDPEAGSLKRLLSYKTENIYQRYLFIPLGERGYIVIRPPYSICVSPTWQGGCVEERHYRGKALVVDLKGNALKTIDLPERTEVYLMDGAFVFCRERCVFVDGNLRTKPLGFGGFSNGWRGEDVKVFFDGDETFLLFKDGSFRKVPKGCRVRVHSRTVFCLYNETEAELRDLKTWNILGRTSAVPYPDHVYERFVLKGRVMVLKAESGRVVDYRRLECEGLPPQDVVFNRDRFYVIYSDHSKVCMEAFRIDVD